MLTSTVQLISQSIIQQRAKLDLTQDRLSELAGVCVQTIRKAERGSVDLRISTVVKLARVLEISLDEVLL